MTRHQPNLHITTRRFTVRSTIEVPLTVDATDWATALDMALMLLEREHRLPYLVCQVDGDGVVTASDPHTGEVFALESGVVARASRAA